jgi:hypothetical protein
MAKQSTSADKELQAIRVILSSLEKLDGESIQRVLDYVFGRLSLGHRPRAGMASVTTSPALQLPSEGSLNRRPSIRDLKDQKQPGSSNQMAALVAYYLSEVAAEPERKESVNTSDLEKYFKQAGFRLPKRMPQVLPNAAAAGYLDAAGSGYYRLNPVGYNLVVHAMPRSYVQAAKSGKQPRRKRRSKARG